MTFPDHTLNNYVVGTRIFQKFSKIFLKFPKNSEKMTRRPVQAPAMGTIGAAARGISDQKEIDGNGDGDVFEVRTFCPILGAQHVSTSLASF